MTERGQISDEKAKSPEMFIATRIRHADQHVDINKAGNGKCYTEQSR